MIAILSCCATLIVEMNTEEESSLSSAAIDTSSSSDSSEKDRESREEALDVVSLCSSKDEVSLLCAFTIFRSLSMRRH